MSLIEYLCLRYLAHISKWGVQIGASEVVFFLLQRKFCIIFSISFSMNFAVVYIGQCTKVWIKRFGFICFFFISRLVAICSIFILNSEYWFQITDSFRFVKVGIPPSKKNFISFNETPLKLVKNAFYFILKDISVVKIFKFLSWLFGHVEKAAWLKEKGILKLMTSCNITKKLFFFKNHSENEAVSPASNHFFF